MTMLKFNKKNKIRRPREFRWYTRGVMNGKITIVGGFLSEDEAVNAGLKMGGYYETKMLPTIDLDEASRIFRYQLFNDADSDEMPHVFDRFRHKMDKGE